MTERVDPHWREPEAGVGTDRHNGRPISVNYGFSGDDADLRDCAATIRRGSKSFHLASMILPSRTRRAAHALYAFCRHSDDLVDEPRASKDGLASLRHRLDLIYAGRPQNHACDRAFARTVRDYNIPKIVPDALLDGFAMDLDGRRYQTLAEVKDYATCVASTVGIMMSMVMGTGDPHALARAADLGIAMQLTNIARDVGEDARNGRLYLPQDWLDEFSIDRDAFLARPTFSPAIGQIVRRLLSEADRHYRLGHAGIAALPADCRHAIRTAALVYEEIGNRIAENGHDSVSSRARTSLSVKLGLILKARGPEPARATATLDRPADPATHHLVEAAAGAFRPIEPVAEGATGTVDRFSIIMMRLEARNREGDRFRRTMARQKADNLA